MQKRTLILQGLCLNLRQVSIFACPSHTIQDPLAVRIGGVDLVLDMASAVPTATGVNGFGSCTTLMLAHPEDANECRYEPEQS